MPKHFGVTSVDHVGNYSVGEVDSAGKVMNPYHPGLSVYSPYICCGLGTLAGFRGTPLTTFGDKAAFIAALRRDACTYGRRSLSFVVNPKQKVFSDFQVLLEAGAKMIVAFPNIQPGHSGYNLEMYLWNPQDAIGIFYDSDGLAFTEDPRIQKVAPVVVAPAVPAPRTRSSTTKETSDV